MIKITTTIAVSLLMTACSFAQNITFDAPDPQPELVQVYGGSSDSGDIDGDGDNDLLLVGLTPGRETALYLNDGNGNFTEVLDIPFPEAVSSVTVFVDFDGDEDLDLFFSGQGNGISSFTHIYLNDGDGNFSLHPTPELPDLEDTGVGIEDVDGDGDQDILICAVVEGSDFFSDIFLNDGNANFSPVGTNVFTPVFFGHVRFLDLENDGDADVVITGEDEDDQASMLVYSNDGDGNFSALGSAGLLTMSADGLDVADIDGDGDTDILMSGMDSEGVVTTALFLNNGSGEFSELEDSGLQQTFAANNAIADLDNDGDNDILIMGSQAGGIPNIYNIVYENLGNNEFAPSDTLGGEYIATNTVNDFTGDGLADIIIQGFVDDVTVWWNTTIVNSVEEFTTVENDYSIFPNPVNVELNIASVVDLKNTSYRIFDELGRPVLNGTLSGMINSIPVQDLPAGIYLLMINDTAQGVTRFIKQ